MIFRRRRPNRTSSAAGPWAEANAKAIFNYEMLLQREMDQDSMLWETPTLALTAQAFLLTIALNKDSAPVAVCISAGLGGLVAFLSLQLMAKHRFLNELDRAELHRLEDELGLRHLSRRNYFYRDGAYVVPAELQGKERKAPGSQGFLESRSSYLYWTRGMWAFAIVNLTILLTEIFWPAVLHTVTP